jgi:acetylornithine/LysW-gamma-L-lysine aminotransferase
MDSDPDVIRALEDSHGTGVTPKRDLAIVRGEGSWLIDMEGRRFLDLGANFGVCNVGHCHPKVVDAVQSQVARLVYVTPTVHNDVRAHLSGRLADMAPGDMDRVFLANSGTEAVEAALKFARKHTRRTGFVATKRAFHGRTMGALSITWKKKYRVGFEPLLPDCDFVTYGDLEALKGAVGHDTAAVVLEAVQGEGGVHPAPEGYLRGVREVCDDAGALLVVDEVQTGLGRTGRMFAVEHSGVVPDMLTLAKSLGSGLPIGAMIARSEVCDLPPGSHGNTFAGSPVSCAAALATLDVLLEEGLPERASALGERSLKRLGLLAEATDIVREVRGLGLMLGIDLRQRAGPHLSAMLEKGVFAIPAGTTVIRLLPPLTISEEDLDHGIEVIEDVLSPG